MESAKKEFVIVSMVTSVTIVLSLLARMDAQAEEPVIMELAIAMKDLKESIVPKNSVSMNAAGMGNVTMEYVSALLCSMDLIARIRFALMTAIITGHAKMESAIVKMDTEELSAIKKFVEMIALEMESALKGFATVNLDLLKKIVQDNIA